MADPWTFALALLDWRPHAAPAIAWPAGCRRVVIKLGPDDEPDIPLPPEPPEPARLHPLDGELLELLRDEGCMATADVMAAIGLPRDIVRSRLRSMRARGLVQLQHDGWMNA